MTAAARFSGARRRARGGGVWISDPDRRIAAHDVARYEATGRIDTAYLGRLSADAVPVLLRLPEPPRG